MGREREHREGALISDLEQLSEAYPFHPFLYFIINYSTILTIIVYFKIPPDLSNLFCVLGFL